MPYLTRTPQGPGRTPRDGGALPGGARTGVHLPGHWDDIVSRTGTGVSE